MRKIEFITSNNCLYHIYNRGVDKRTIFNNETDLLRFIHDLYEFNDTKPAKQFSRAKNRSLNHNITKEKRELFVEILAYCLMPNHFHLMLRQKKDRGIEEFMHKLGTGYTMYFNRKNERSGVLFQGRFKAVPVKKETQLRYLIYYIHTNPLDLFQSNWKENGIANIQKALDFLMDYRWSSYLDYIGKHNFPSVISKNFIEEIYEGNAKEHKKDLKEWFSNINKNITGKNFYSMNFLEAD